MQPQQPRRPVWPWVLGGCFFLVIGTIVAVSILFNLGMKKIVANVDENLKNPKVREQTAKKLLHAETLPPGYYPISGTFDLPLITHVRLSDRAPDARGSVVGYDNRGFAYTDSLHSASSAQLERFFEGAADAPGSSEVMGLRLRAKEELGRGRIELGDQTIRYRTVRGRVEEGADFELEGLLTLMLIDCAGPKREKTAVWFSRETPDAPVADDAKIRELMGHFQLCAPR
jgi:hypothetical protein